MSRSVSRSLNTAIPDIGLVTWCVGVFLPLRGFEYLTYRRSVDLEFSQGPQLL